MERLVSPAVFDEPIKAGREYILLDDHITVGGTLADEANYVVSRGGRVVAVTTLTASRGSTNLRLSNEQLEALKSRPDYERIETTLNEQGKTARSLTLSEARQVGRFKDVDSLRAAIAEAKRSKDNSGVRSELDSQRFSVAPGRRERAQRAAAESLPRVTSVEDALYILPDGRMLGSDLDREVQYGGSIHAAQSVPGYVATDEGIDTFVVDSGAVKVVWDARTGQAGFSFGDQPTPAQRRAMVDLMKQADYVGVDRLAIDEDNQPYTAAGSPTE